MARRDMHRGWVRSGRVWWAQVWCGRVELGMVSIAARHGSVSKGVMVYGGVCSGVMTW